MAKRREVVDPVGVEIGQRPNPRGAHEPAFYTIVKIHDLQKHWFGLHSQRVELKSGGKTRRMTLRGSEADVRNSVAIIRKIELLESAAQGLERSRSAAERIRAASRQLSAISQRNRFAFLHPCKSLPE